ncbi:MAG: hypothetical protein H6765_01915 [Candidatus Peribacteria bacterium]|nr:MAG: hypothetical protein H6765_01915 [Candidatus Peribacteria bacterium]
MEQEITSPEKVRLETGRPERFQQWIDEKHQWLKEVVLRIMNDVANAQLRQGK